MFCGHCGEKNLEQYRFCFECGARLYAIRAGGDEPIVDELSARLQGLRQLPEPRIDWPEGLDQTQISVDGSRLLLVPAGFFWMGTQKQKKDERPCRLVYLDSYYIDETPVTNQQYAEFLTKKGGRKPAGFSKHRHASDWDQLPVTGVTWHEACEYARWAQKRLPTEAEWEKAARGIDRRLWPWGDEEPAPEHAHLGVDLEAPAAVKHHEKGRSPYGALGMAGNVWEWCQDQYDQFFYPRSPPRNPCCTDGDHRYRVLRGGAFGYSAFTARVSFRGWNLPDMRSSCYGFRCAVNPRGSASS